jgi:prepilin-type N-terminal cleavage/methylation domain-containing protein
MRNLRAGFTLLELLLAMSLMVMVAACLYGSLHIAFKARESVQNAMDQANAGELGLDLVRQDLSEALPPTGILAGLFTGTDQQGDNGRDADSMDFFTSANSLTEPAGTCDTIHVNIAMGTDEDGKPALVRNVTANLLAPETPVPTTEVLCRNVQGLNLRYFDGTNWLDSWDSGQENNQLPLAVEVTLEMQPRPGAVQPADATSANADQGPVITRVLLPPCAYASSSSSNVNMPSSRQ